MEGQPPARRVEQLVRSLAPGEERGGQLVWSFRMEGSLHKLAKTPQLQGNFTEWVRVLVSARIRVSRSPLHLCFQAP